MTIQNNIEKKSLTGSLLVKNSQIRNCKSSFMMLKEQISASYENTRLDTKYDTA